MQPVTAAPPPAPTAARSAPRMPVYRSRWATAVFDLLNPVPYGFFVGALIFDIVYANSRNVFWGKEAAWLVSIGLVFAIVPRAINLCHVWLPSRYPSTQIEKLDFWLNLVAIAAAILNAFVHSRDAYAMVPENVILSVVTVALLGVAQIASACGKAGFKETLRDE